MSQGQRTSNPAMNSIEDIIERLLQHGANITDALENEVNHARLGNTSSAPKTRVVEQAPSSSELNTTASMDSSFIHGDQRFSACNTSMEANKLWHREVYGKELFSGDESSQKAMVDDISSDMLVPPMSEGSTKSEAVTKKSDHFLGVESFPCFLGDGEGTTVERKARVTFHRKADSSWLPVRFEVNDLDGTTLLVLRTELLGRMMKNTVINGKPVQ